MSVNSLSSFSNAIFGELLAESSPPGAPNAAPNAAPALVEPEARASDRNLADAAAAKHGISVQTERARLTAAARQDKDVQYQPGKLTGKDGKVYNRSAESIADDERFGILVENIGKTDSRETILYKGYEAAAKAAGYGDQAAARIAGALVDEQKQIEDSTGEQRATTFNERTKAPRDNRHLDDVRASGKLRFRVTGATLKHIEAVDQRQISQQTVMNELAQGKSPSNELLQKAGVDREKLDAVLKEIGWQPVPTLDEAVDKLAAEKKADVFARREKYQNGGAIDTGYTNSKWYGMTDAQITAETRREAEADVRRAIGKGELQIRSENQPATISARTPTLADRARPIIEKYLPGIAALNTPEGIKTTNVEAFAASYINARLFGATDFYVDKSRFHSERQANEAAAFRMAGSIVGELQNLSAAGKAVEAAIKTPRIAAAVTALRESGTAGKVLAQTLPAATAFGGLETARETVKAATGQSNGIVDATKNVVRASAAGAVFGVFEPLPVAARVGAVAAGSYGVEKVFGATDKDAAISALTNSVFAAAGGSRRAAAALDGKIVRVTGENGTAANVRVSVDAGRRIVLTEVAANAKADLQVKLSALKERAGNAVGVVEGGNSRAAKNEQLLRVLNERRQSANQTGGGAGGFGQPAVATANGAPPSGEITSRVPGQTANDLSVKMSASEANGKTVAPNNAAAANNAAAVQLPAEPADVRATLTDNKAIKGFDQRLAEIMSDAVLPDAKKIEKFKGYLESAKQLGEGNLEQGLIRDLQEHTMRRGLNLPYGTPNRITFGEFGKQVREGLSKAGARDAQAYIQGSAVSGIKYTSGQIFDVGRTSDWDMAVASPTLLKRAKEIGVEIRSGGTRTAPLNELQLQKLNLSELRENLSKVAGRKVEIMLYNDKQTVVERNPGSIYVP